MRYIQFDPSEENKIAILVKNSSFNKNELIDHYVIPMLKDARKNIELQDVVAVSLDYNEAGKAPVKFIKEYLEVLMPALEELKTKFIYVADGSYFKVLAGQSTAEPHHGYVFPCKLKGYEHMSIVLGINYQALFYKPDLQDKLVMGINTLVDAVSGHYVPIGTGIIHSAVYPKYGEVEDFLKSLHQYPELWVDIEGFSLSFFEAGIGTIAFAWDEHNGGAFACDYTNVPNGEIGFYGTFQRNFHIRKLLKQFFIDYKGKINWHKSGYDVKVIIYTLWMQNKLDTAGLLEGLDVMCKNMDDTLIIAYLALNSTAGNTLGLKALAHEFAGNWAMEEIKDIRKIPLDKLLQYNLVDSLCTTYVKKKYYPIMVQDQQLDIYQTLMLPSQKMLLQTELTGMPLNPLRVKQVKQELQAIEAKHLNVIRNNGFIKMFDLLVQQDMMNKANAKLKVKQHPLSKFQDELFNPNSGPQLQKLLYDQMGLPIIDLTDSKQPATGADTLKKLINHTNDPVFKEILEALIEYGQVNKILTTFIPAFEKAVDKGDGIVWLHGNFNLNGTVSGRLSSSEPNLQNLPATSVYGKLIKSCFMAPKGWLFGGADFNSLEDYISALTTKDPNKLKVYTDGYDGHCLRAFSYYPDQLPGIVNTVASINSIAKLFPQLRQDSKTPTFALTYQGTWHTLVKNIGMPADKAKAIEARYHELYQVSDAYISQRLHQASKDGYVTVAFGLRVRTPVLAQVVFGAGKMPHEAGAEGRTAGNAMGQSYCMLNNRAAVAFMEEVWKSPYRLLIKPVALIHDAIYLVWKNDLEITEWVNKQLIKAMRWQELPEIQHPTVKIGAALDIFWPNWSNGITLPNDCDQQTIIDTTLAGKDAYLNPKPKEKK